MRDKTKVEAIRVDRPLAAYYRWIKDGQAKSGSATVALGAAMIAVGEILEPEKTSVEVEQVSEDRLGSEELDDLDVTFGDLPKLP